MANGRPIWGIHMARHHGMRPIEEGFIALGWPIFGDPSQVKQTREAFRKRFAEIYPENRSGTTLAQAGTLFRFIHEMAEGDLVVFPSKPDRMVNLGRIESRCAYDPLFLPSYPYQRRVKWLRHLSRTEFSQAALYEIGSVVTLFQIRNTAEEFLAAFSGTPNKALDIDAESTEAVSAEAEETTIDFLLKRLKSALDGYQFEEFVAHLLECMGYHARVTKKSGDGGVDIIAHRDELGFEPPVIKVQCKQTLAVTGEPDVRQFYGAVEPGEHGLFVTLGSYSTQAKSFERGKSNLRLLEGKDLIELIYQHYRNFLSRYQMILPLRQIYIPGAMGKETAPD